MPSPISDLLEQELRHAIQRRGLVVWLDADGQYTAFADRLQARHAAGEFPYPVLGYRGSFLELLLALEPYGSGLDPDKLLIHLPGINRASILQTPLFELYKAGKEHQKNLGTLIEEAALGRVPPEATSQFLSQGVPALDAADAWLEAQCQKTEGALERYLGAVDVEHVLRDLASGRGELAAALERLDERASVLDYLHRSIGLPEDFRVLKGVLEEAGDGALPRAWWRRCWAG